MITSAKNKIQTFSSSDLKCQVRFLSSRHPQRLRVSKKLFIKSGILFFDSIDDVTCSKIAERFINKKTWAYIFCKG